VEIRDTFGEADSPNSWSCDDGANKESDKQEEHGKVEDSKAYNAPTAKLRLLKRVNWWADLSAWPKPEEHDGVQFINLWNEDGRQHNKEYHVAKQEIHCKKPKLGDFTQVFTTGL